MKGRLKRLLVSRAASTAGGIVYWTVSVTVLTADFPMFGAMAMNFSTSLPVIVMGPVYLADVAVGVEPSVV
jgi:hypothetical protein